MRENADSVVVAGVAGNGTRGGSSSGIVVTFWLRI